MSRPGYALGRWPAAVLAALAAVGCGDGDGSRAARCGEPGVICTLAGTGEAALGRDGIGPTASALYLPQDVAVGPNGLVYVADWNNHRVRRIDGDGKIRTIAGTGELGDPAAGGDAASTPLFHPTDVAFGGDGVLYIAVWHSNVIAAVHLLTGQVEIVCGNGEFGLAADGSPAAQAALGLPAKLAVDGPGRLYFTDQGNQRVRRIALDGTLETVLGPPATDPCEGEDCAAAASAGFAGDGGRADEARISLPYASMSVPAGGIAFGPDGTLYLADTGNHRIRALSPTGAVSTVAGRGPDDPNIEGRRYGDGGPATEAHLNRPGDVAVAADGTLYIADTANSCVRRVAVDGTITTAAGVCGQRGDAGDGGPALQAVLNRPYGIAVGPDGRLYIADTHNHRIRTVSPGGTWTE